MSYDIHTLEAPDGLAGFANTDRVIFGMASIANAAGGSAGVSVSVTGLETAFANLPANYMVIFDCGQEAVAFATNKTATGFQVTLYPVLAAQTLAAGTVNVLVVG